MKSTAIGLIGAGSIGSTVASALRAGRVEGCTLGGILADEAPPLDELVDDLDSLLATCDMVVEAAGHGALAAYGTNVLSAGHDLMVVSVGALADESLRQQLWESGPGRLLLSTGAIGGLDTLRAANLVGDLDSVELTTTKPGDVLVEDWMTDDLIEALRHGDAPAIAFDGVARDAVRLFPKSVNIAATLSLATVGFDRTRVRVIGDPDITHVEHVVRASGVAGSYEFRFRNRPSPQNPRTSGIVPFAILRALSDRTARTVIGV